MCVHLECGGHPALHRQAGCTSAAAARAKHAPGAHPLRQLRQHLLRVATQSNCSLHALQIRPRHRLLNSHKAFWYKWWGTTSLQLHVQGRLGCKTFLLSRQVLARTFVTASRAQDGRHMASSRTYHTRLFRAAPAHKELRTSGSQALAQVSHSL